jgi:transcriptional regulatory protein LevR
MAFCVETFRKNKWKVIRETIVTGKEEAEKMKESLQATCSTDEDRHLPVKEKYRVRRLRQKEADALMKKEVVV